MECIFFAEFTDAIDILKQYGPFCGVLVLALAFYLWRDWKREDRLSNRIDALENETRNVLLPLVKDCTAVVAKNTQVMERLEHIIDSR